MSYAGEAKPYRNDENGPHPPQQEATTKRYQQEEQPAAYKDHLDNWFTYHEPTAEQVTKYRSIRAAGRALAEAIVINAPACADRSDAIRKVREAVMVANAAIACRGW